MRLKHVASLMLLCNLLFILSACSLFGFGDNGNAKPTPTPKAATSFTVYTGDGYEISYPQGWKTTTGANGLVTFTDPQGIAYVAIQTTPNPGGTVPAKDQVKIGLQAFKAKAKNYQDAGSNPQNTIGGETWEQGAATGDVTPEGQNVAVTAKIIVDATNHPPSEVNTKSYVIAYATGQQVFDLTNMTYFQPMLQSFKFK